MFDQKSKKINWKFLTTEQKNAVVNVDGFNKVIAGAGTGKTTFILYKILYLITKCHVPPYRIGVITFTNKAKNEIATRLTQYLPRAIAYQVLIKTYHGLATMILWKQIELLADCPFTKNFHILTASSERKIIREFITINAARFDLEDEFSHNNNKIERHIDQLTLKWSNLVSETLSKDFDDIHRYFANLAQNQAQEIPKKLQPVFTADQNDLDIIQFYEKFKKSNNYLSYSDLLFYAYLCLSEVKQCLSYWNRKIKYWMVDEFQDTNNIQFHLISYLSQFNGNLTVVGDPDQNMYSWRGSDSSLLVYFEKFFSNAKSFFFTLNQRSTKYILNLANSSIKWNQNRLDYALVSARSKQKSVDSKPSIVHFAKTYEQNKWIIAKIKNNIKKKHHTYSDFLVLSRFASGSMTLKHELKNHNIPYKNLRDGSALFDKRLIKYIISYLSLVVSANDLALGTNNLFWEEVMLGVPAFGEKGVASLKSLLMQKNIKSFEVLFKEAKDYFLQYKKTQKLLTFIEQLKKFRQELKTTWVSSKHVDVKPFMEKLFSKTNFFTFDETKTVSLNDRTDCETLLCYMDEFNFDEAEYDSDKQKRAGKTVLTKITYFLQQVNLGFFEEKDGKVNSVSLGTIHAAKGTESTVVFVLYCNDGIIPSFYAKTKEEREEERRNFHVAITRAKDELYLLTCQQIWKKDDWTPSVYLERLDHRCFRTFDYRNHNPLGHFKKNNFMSKKIPSQKTVTNNNNKEANFTSYQPQNYYKINDKVFHNQLGEGQIMAILNFNLKIKFAKHAVRLIHVQDSNLTKI